MKNAVQKKNILSAFAVLLSLAAAAQPNKPGIDEELFRSLHGNGSMNVVLTVIGIILAGLFLTLFRMDRKLSKLEKEIKEKKS
ncbi:MAG TPA: CcmD family protein [Bacteroidia bacterium]|nr:CcmD family protein [Bacteroidia bacterium]